MSVDSHANSLAAIAIHASAVCANGQALIFLGPSGAGKSTICDLLKGYTETLALDAVYLVVEANRWQVIRGDGYAHVKPFTAKIVAKCKVVPLQAIFRLYQASTPDVEPIDALQTCRYLTDAFFEIIRQREDNFETKRLAFANLAAIARAIPGYEFHFDLSPRTSNVLNKAIKLW
jgi:hypothetical protein